ncbi:MAG: T9SS type A sorting domain-containing protein [bacterium]|nr:MAG: T9SS type A sorting domain-containing protein [bacterium]
MRRSGLVLSLMCLCVFIFSTSVVYGQSGWTIVAWGNNEYSQCNVPAPNANFVAIAGGGDHSLGLKSDGTIVAWGYNNDGQCDVPEPNDSFVAVAGGYDHSMGLRSSGRIVAWGNNDYGQCSVPAPNADFVEMALGCGHSLGLKSDGVIVTWGNNDRHQCDVPAPNDSFVAVAAGYDHSLGLKSDGTIWAWGSNDYGQCSVPEPNTDFMEIAAGRYFSLGLKSDGTIVTWGWNYYGQCDVPEPNTGFVEIAAGRDHSLGLKSDGTIRAWGSNEYGQCDVPAQNEYFVAVAGGRFHNLSLEYENPNAVAFSSIAADSRDGAIVLLWEVITDEALNGFQLYRAMHQRDFSCINDAPLSPYTRTYEDRTIKPGKEYRYIVAALTLDGREIRSPEVIAIGIAPPLALNQNVPNPFNPQTTIGFSLPRSEHVWLDIYDLRGRLVHRLIDKLMEAGRHEIEWCGRDSKGRAVASGVYFYRLTVSKQASTKKMILLR